MIEAVTIRGRQDVGQHFADDNAQVRIADTAGCKNVFALANRAHFGANQAGDGGPGNDPDGKNQGRHRRLGDCHQRHQQHKAWHGLKNLDQTLQAIVDAPAEVPGQGTDAQAQQHPEQAGEQPHLQGYAAAVNDAGHHVAAHGIGAQRVVPVLSRPQQRIGVHRQRVAGIEHRRKHGEGGDGQQKQQPGNRCRVA